MTNFTVALSDSGTVISILVHWSRLANAIRENEKFANDFVEKRLEMR